MIQDIAKLKSEILNKKRIDIGLLLRYHKMKIIMVLINNLVTKNMNHKHHKNMTRVIFSTLTTD